MKIGLGINFFRRLLNGNEEQELQLKGPFALISFDGIPLMDTLENPNINGLALRADMNTICPSAGVYDFSYVDEMIDDATNFEKDLSIYFGRIPQWLLATCQKVGNLNIPVPDDPNLLFFWKSFMDEVGTRYRNNTVIKGIRGSVELLTDAWAWPDNPTQFGLIGYTNARLVNAAKFMLETQHEAMPKHVTLVGLGRVPFSMALTGESGLLAGDLISSNAIGTQGQRAMLWRENANACFPDSPGLDDQGKRTQWSPFNDYRGRSGCQLNSVLSNRVKINPCNTLPNTDESILTITLNKLKGYECNYAEIYEPDCNKLNLAEILRNYRDQ